jgi:hypothetical protein
MDRVWLIELQLTSFNLHWFEFTYIELEKDCQTSLEAYPVWCIHECGGSGGCSGGS